VSEQAALAELVACAGTQFDPRVVDTFAHVLNALSPEAVTAAAV
jgi:HD-GYP domain-containing protein (c-di-GMP phosphodiesterase class II)